MAMRCCNAVPFGKKPVVRRVAVPDPDSPVGLFPFQDKKCSMLVFLERKYPYYSIIYRYVDHRTI
jgi:hypothetical protein